VDGFERLIAEGKLEGTGRVARRNRRNVLFILGRFARRPESDAELARVNAMLTKLEALDKAVPSHQVVATDTDLVEVARCLGRRAGGTTSAASGSTGGS
jgi:hypothetical protein